MSLDEQRERTILLMILGSISIHAEPQKDQVGQMQVNCCQICQSQVGISHPVREMMLGTRDEFLYWECSDCGCLSLTAVPTDLGKYYPGDYYSLQIRTPKLLRKIRDHLYLSRLSFLVNWRKRTDLDVIRRIGLKKNMALLDVGCGSGTLLADLRELGYNARGVDPFVPCDIRDRFGVRVERKTLAEVDSKFDVILFRHSLEHMPINMLGMVTKHLKRSGLCVVCIPVLGWAWRSYTTDWAQLDAPRHFFLHSRKSFSLLAEKSGFRIERVVYDSNEFQFWASESYQRDIPLSKMLEPNKSQLRRMRRLAKSLNSQEQGDTAQFYLRPA
ncbi:class I SAM-dependent methyltransferase [Acidicapsa ligni]|uniref:class I SAM-dependent methyltransferase n=1 Tax=Acidicapsa ligni TaxID=542300 RepID=UPI0021E04D9B|nr:class I SAM-dependent methyltransferase [Acidicapsa ligni]